MILTPIHFPEEAGYRHCSQGGYLGNDGVSLCLCAGWRQIRTEGAGSVDVPCWAAIDHVVLHCNDSLSSGSMQCCSHLACMHKHEHKLKPMTCFRGT